MDMYKIRRLKKMLIFMALALVFTVFDTVAAEALTEEQILGNAEVVVSENITATSGTPMSGYSLNSDKVWYVKITADLKEKGKFAGYYYDSAKRFRFGIGYDLEKVDAIYYTSSSTSNTSKIEKTHTPSQEYTYLIQFNPDTTIVYYAKDENADTYTEVASSTGCQVKGTVGGATFVEKLDLSSGCSYNSVNVTIYQAEDEPEPEPEKTYPLLTDADTIVSSKEKTVYSESFDNCSIGDLLESSWSSGLSGAGSADVEDGRLVLRSNGEKTAQNLHLNCGTIPSTYSAEFVMYASNGNGDGQGTLILTTEDKRRITVKCYENGNVFVKGDTSLTVNIGDGDKPVRVFIDVRDNVATVYAQPEGEECKTVCTNMNLENFGSVECKIFASATGRNEMFYIDDLKIYSGMCIEHELTYPTDNEAEASFKLYFGTPEDDYSRSAVAVVAAYDENGIMRKCAFEEATVKPLEETEVKATLSIENIDDYDVKAYLINSMDIAKEMINTTGVNGESLNVTECDAVMNTVAVSGTTGTKTSVTAVLQDVNMSEIFYISQTETDENGEFLIKIPLDASLNNGGTYKLQLYAEGQLPYFTEADLKGKDNFTGLIELFKSAEDSGDAVKAYEAAEQKLALASIGDEIAINCFATAFLRNKDSNAFADENTLADFINNVTEAKDSYAEAISLINAAVDGNRWADIQDVMEKTHSNCFEELSDRGSLSAKNVYLEMLDTDYTAIEDIESKYNSVVKDLKSSKNNKGSGSGSISGGRGSSVGATVIQKTDADKTLENIIDAEYDMEEEKMPKMPFNDSEEALWANEYISYLRQKGIVHGNGDGYFQPNNSITRGEFIKMIVLAFQLKDTGKGENVSFNDVSVDDWAYEYVRTAVNLGVVKGYDNGDIGKDDNITRADMAVMLHRICEVNDLDVSAVNPARVFEDHYLIPDYAYSAVSTLNQMNIISGYSDNTFMPVNMSTRAESCAMIYRMLEIIGGGIS